MKTTSRSTDQEVARWPAGHPHHRTWVEHGKPLSGEAGGDSPGRSEAGAGGQRGGCWILSHHAKGHPRISQQPGRLRALLSQEDTHRRSTGQVSERKVGNSKVALPLCPHSLRCICNQSLQPKCSPSVYRGLSWIPDNWTTPPRCPGQRQSLSRVRLCVTPMDCGPSSSSVPRDSPGHNTEVGCHALLQGIFPTQG